MCINENQEFETINQKTSERKFVAETQVVCKEEYHRVKKAKAKKKAIVLLVVTLVVLIASMVGIIGLEMIGWINDIFQIVLMCIAGSVAMFKCGYLWHEIKQ